jgi:hypothetical protein
MINKFFAFLNKHKNTIIPIAAILLIAIFFRFYNYSNRWGLASDQARDAILVTQALKMHVIPLIGAFSASGPFVFGPYMYWFMMLAGIILPFGFIAYWLALGILSVFMIIVRMAIGTEIKDKYFGFLIGLLATVSTLKVSISTNLISSSLAGSFSVIAIYFFVRVIKYTKSLDIFLLGLFIGLGINTHFQTIPLLVTLPVVYVFGKLKPKHLIFMLSGLAIPFIPLLIFDFRTNFYESSHILHYFFNFGQPVSFPKRWLTYSTTTFPSIYASIIGGNLIMGTLIMVTTGLTFIYFLIRRQIDRITLAIGFSLGLIFIVLRYFPGQIFGDFVAFMSPFIIILTAWVCLKIFNFNKYLGILVIITIFLSTAITSFNDINSATNLSAPNAQKLKNILVQKFPKGTKFSIYDYDYKNTGISLPLVLYLSQEGKISDDGEKIGIANLLIKGAKLKYSETETYVEFLYTLQGNSDKKLMGNGWVSVNPSNVYNSVENWYK